MSSEAEQFFVEHGFPEGFVAKRNGKVIVKQNIIDEFKSNKSIVDIADEFSLSYVTVWKVLKEASLISSLKINRSKPKTRVNGHLINRIFKLYVDGLRTDEIAERLKIGQTLVWKTLTSCGIKLSGIKPVVCVADDGHKCRSEHERLIDNWFYRNGVEHVYEPRVEGVRNKPDWYVSKWDRYVEFQFVGNVGSFYERSHVLKVKMFKKLFGERFVLLTQNDWLRTLQKLAFLKSSAEKK